MNRSRFSPPSLTKPLKPDEFRQALEEVGVSARSSDAPQADVTSSAAIVAKAAAIGATRPPPRRIRADSIERLPAQAAEKLRQLRARDQDAGALLQHWSGQKSEVMQRKQRAELRLRELTDPEVAARTGSTPVIRTRLTPDQDGRIVADFDHPSVRQAVAERDAAQREFGEIDSRIAAIHSKRWGSGLRRLKDWLVSLPPRNVEAHDSAVNVPKKTTIEAARERIAALKADIREAQSAPFPRAVVRAQLHAEVRALAARGAPNLLPSIEAGQPLAWPMLQVRGEITAVSGDGLPARGFTQHAIADTLAIFCWLHRDAILSALNAEIDALADDENALTDQQRASKITALRAQLLDAERIEEALIEKTEAEGVLILRRNDADPRAVLNLSSALPAPR